jgi:hypothetical protein
MQLINQVYLKIIMFGFLIAMIKNTFDRNNKLKEHNMYIQRCEMNQISFNIYRLIPFVSVFETDLVVVSSYFENNKVEMNVDEDSNKVF